MVTLSASRPATLRAAPQEIIGPFQREFGAAEIFDRLRQRDAGDKAELGRERGRTGIDDQAAGVEIAGRRAPEAPLAAAPVGLLLGDDPQPAAIAGERERARLVVGRADAGQARQTPAGEQGFGVDPPIKQSVQNNDFAAAIAVSVKGAG